MREYYKYIISFDLDDFCTCQNPDHGGLMQRGVFGYLDILWERFPDMKITMFTIPNLEGKHPLAQSPEWCSWVRSLIAENKIEIALHGYEHTSCEFSDMSWDETKERILKAEEILREADIPLVKGFKAPHLKITDNVYRALMELEYQWIVIMPNDTSISPIAPIKYPGLRYVQKWYALGNNLPLDREVLLINGCMKTKGVKNGLSPESCYYTLAQLHRLSQYADLDFRFLSDVAMMDVIEEAVPARGIQEKIEKLHREDEKVARFIQSMAKPGLKPVSGWRLKWLWYTYKTRGIIVVIRMIVGFFVRRAYLRKIYKKFNTFRS